MNQLMIKYLVFLGMSSCEQRNRQQMVRNMYSLGPRPKTNPSEDRFQYHALYWKRYTCWM